MADTDQDVTTLQTQLKLARARIAMLEQQLEQASTTHTPAAQAPSIRLTPTTSETSEQSVQGIQHFLYSTLDALAAHVVVLDSSGIISHANAAWTRFAELNDAPGHVKHYIGTNYLDVCESASGKDSEEGPLVAHGIRAVISGERDEFYLEYPCHSPMEKRWFALRVTPFAESAPRRVVVSHTLITERVEAEMAVQTSRDYLASVLNSIDDVIVSVILPDNHVVYISPNFEKVIGYPAHRFISSPEFHKQIIHPADRQVAVQARLDALGSGYTEVEHRIILPDESIRWLRRRTSVTFDRQKRPLRVNEVISDMTVYKQAQENIQRQNTILQQSRDLIALSDLDGSVVYINPAGAALLDFAAPEAIIGSSVHDYHEQEDADFIVNEAMPFAARTGAWRGETRLKTPSGRLIDVDQVIFPILDETGSLQNYATIAVDMTERKQTQAALHESEQLFRQFMEHLPGTVFIVDEANRLTYCNARYAESLGYHDSQLLIGKHMAEYLPPEIYRLAFAENEEIRAQNRALEFNYTQVAPKHLIHWHIVKFPVPRENLPPFIGAFAVDVTREKQAEAALQKARDLLERRVLERTAELQQTKNRLEVIFNNTGDGIVLVDRDFSVQQTNRALNVLLGITPDAVDRLSLRALIHPDAAALFESVVHQVADYFMPQRVELVAVRSDGSFFDAEVSVAPVRLADKDDIRLICVFHDVSERKASEEKLRGSEEKLRTSQQMLKLVLDTIPVRVFWKDRASVYQGCNRLFAEDAGLEHTTNILGKRDADLPWAKEFAAVYTVDDRVIMEKGIIKLDYEETQIRADGSTLVVQTSKLPLRDDSGSIIGVLGMYLDITARKHAESALLRSEERYRSLVNNMSEGLVLQDAAGAIQMCNPAAERMLGLTADQIMGRTSTDPHWHAIQADGSPFPGNMHPAMVALCTGQPVSHTVMGVHKPDHTLTWIMINAQPLFDPGAAKPHAVIATFTDITERKEAEAVLQQKHRDEQVMNQYLKALHEASIALTRTNTLDEFYRQTVELGLRLFGFERMGLLLYDAAADVVQGTYGTDPQGRVVREAHIRFKPDELTGILRRSMERSEGFILFTDTPLFADYEPIGRGWNAAAVLWTGDAQGWLVVDNAIEHEPPTKGLLDILSLYALTVGSLLMRRRIEEQLQALSQRLELATRSGGIGIWEWRITEDKFISDERMRLFYGFAPDRASTNIHDWSACLHPDDYANVEREMNAALAGDKEFDTEFRLVQPNHGIRHIKSRAVVVYDEHGAPERLIGVHLDISDRKRYEETLERALEQEKELGDLKSRFVSMASHEFRTPLAAILATTETLTIYRDRMDNAQIDLRLDKIRQQVMRMKGIMEDVLQLTRIQAGRVEFDPVQSDLDALCREIIEEFEIQPEHQGRIIYACAKPPVIALFDLRLMHHVVTNLISNALKYSTPTSAVQVHLARDTSHITFIVKDEGIGIPPEDLRHLFEPFHRAKNVGTVPGTGLGLSITRQAVDIHGGSITIDSHVNAGTTCTVVFPLA